MTRREEQWGVALQREQQRARLRTRLPLGVQKKSVDDAMIQEKIHLKSAISTKDQRVINNAVKKLIELRGQQLAYRLEELKERFGTVDRSVADALVQGYYEDCYRLAYSFSHVG